MQVSRHLMDILKKFRSVNIPLPAFHRRDSEVEERLKTFLRDNPSFPVSVLPDIIFRMQFLAHEKVPPANGLSRICPELPSSLLQEAQQRCQLPQFEPSVIEALRTCQKNVKEELFRILLLLFNACQVLPDEADHDLRVLAELTGMPPDQTDSILKLDREERLKKQNLVNSSTGLLAAVVIILLFFLSAIFLRTLFFGFLLAVLFLPVEQFLEKKIFHSRFYIGLETILALPFLPLRKLKSVLETPKDSIPPTQAEKERKKRTALSIKGAVLTLFLIAAAALIFLSVLFTFLKPVMVNASKDIAHWYSTAAPVFKVENVVRNALSQPQKKAENPVPESSTSDGEGKSSTAAEKTEAVQPAPPDKETMRELLQRKLKGFLAENADSVAGFIFGSGTDLVHFLVSIVGKIGGFAFDFILTIFFFFAFLQQLAFHTGNSRTTIGTWTVGTIFGSAWLPLTDDETRRSAADIIDHVCNMFNDWLRGYFCIIFLEWMLYPAFFIFFGVPYAVPLALLSGCAVLIPLIGPIVCIGTTYCMVLAFADAHLAFTLTGLTITYLLVNGILEQLILYPTLVGKSVGLKMMETIMVILLSSLFGSITAMIAAIPTAAIIKYLIPRIYKSLNAAIMPSTSDALKKGKTIRPAD